jgi:hypothetical protein
MTRCPQARCGPRPAGISPQSVAALEYLQAWAGVTRTGYHGTRVGGREPGRFEHAGLIGYDHPDDPIGPEPSHQRPDQRAAWHQAFAALGPAGGPGVRAMPDGQLWLLRDTYAAETA